MKGRNHMNVNFATKFLIRRYGSDKEKHFKIHIKSVHEGKKPHECELWGKVFPKIYSLKQDMESICEGNKLYYI